MSTPAENKLRYLAYFRKSTESDERQVQSIPDQKDWANKVTNEQRLTIIKSREESKSAKKPGRTQFDLLIKDINDGKVNAVLAYDPSRLARNALDGARIIDLLDSGKLQAIVTSTSTFRNTSTDKFMLSFFFAQSKHYVDNLSEVTMRGMRSKAKKGVFPGRAKFGYLNHPRTKEIVPDPEVFPYIKELYEIYATGYYGLREMSEVSYDMGLRNFSGGMLSKSQIMRILSDPFYYGAFRWADEDYEGVHEPAVSHELWEAVERVRSHRGHTISKWRKQYPFLGMFRCEECGASITAEKHTKKYKNGSSQTWHYYRCTKKSGTLKCRQPFTREEVLNQSIADRLQKISLREDCAEAMLEQIDRWQAEEGSRESVQIVELEFEIEKIEAKLRRLTDLHIDGELDMSDYKKRKSELIKQKIASQTRLKLVSREGVRVWLEPLRELINAVRERNLPTAGSDLLELRNFVAKVGSNLRVNSRNALWDWILPYALLAERGESSGWQPVGESNPCCKNENLVS